MNILELDAERLELSIIFEKGLNAKQSVKGHVYIKDIIMGGRYDEIRIPCSDKTQLIIKDPVINYLGAHEPRCEGFIYVQEIWITGYVTMVPWEPWRRNG